VPSWESTIDWQPVVFIGTVVGLRPNQKPDRPDIVSFKVDTPIRGVSAATYEAEQGGEGECSTSFSLGDHVIYADVSLPVASVILSEPVTSLEQAQLDFALRLRQ